MPEILLAFMASTAVLAFSPGPDNIYVMLQSMTYGVKYGLATISGLMTGCIIHTSLVAFGVSALIRQSEGVFFAIKAAGAVYLFYLAYQVFVNRMQVAVKEESVPKKTYRQLFVQGFIMNVLNPKVSVFFLAFFPGFLFSQTLEPEIQFFILGGIFIVISFLVFSLIALLAGKISGFLFTHPKAGLYFSWLQIVVFSGIGLFLLFG